MKVVNACRESGLIAGIVIAENIKVEESSPSQKEELQKLVEARSHQESPSEVVRQCVRAMLKKGGFKPTGRNKPASEYLAQAAREHRFPYINNVVDVNNYLSLFFGLPMSLLDLDRTGTDLSLRLGEEGENYVFNSSGHSIDLKGVICVAKNGGEALGNPIKDSMAAKVDENTKNVIAVIYGPSEVFEPLRVEEICREFASMLLNYAGASSTAVMVV